MAKKKVFFSYYYEKDGNKVDDIRGMGLVRDIKPASKKEWDNICSKGDEARLKKGKLLHGVKINITCSDSR